MIYEFDIASDQLIFFELKSSSLIPTINYLSRIQLNNQQLPDQMKIHQQNNSLINNQKISYHNRHHQRLHLDQVQYLDQNLQHQYRQLVHQQLLVKNLHQVNHLNNHNRNQVIRVFVHEL